MIWWATILDQLFFFCFGYIYIASLSYIKVLHAKHKTKIIHYIDFSHSDNASFKVDLLENVQPGEFENLNTKYLVLQST